MVPTRSSCSNVPVWMAIAGIVVCTACSFRPKNVTATGGAGGPSTGSGGSAGAVAAGGTGETESGTETQFGTADGVGTAQGSVSVQHTPEPGAPGAATMIDNACAGTIYRTGVLEPSAS